MRVVLASDWWPPRIGGIESQTADLAAMLASRGHHVHVLTTTRQPVVLPGTTVERVDLPMSGSMATPNPARIVDIVRALERAAPDVVHAHGMFSSFASGAILAARRIGIPSVFTVHSLLRPWPVFLGGAAILHLAAGRADVVTAVSAATAREVRRASGRDVRRVPNGLHLADWRGPGRGEHRTPDGLRVVAVTRLVPKKSPIDLVYALRETVARVARSDISLTIAGDGPERPAMERAAARMGVGGRLRILGRCSREDVRGLLAGASLLAHPGRLEAFGLAILEARAAGVPVVAMDAGGVPDLVEHRRHGLLAPTRAAFPLAVAELAGDDRLRQACAEAAGEGLDEFDWSRVAVQHEEVYAQAVERRGDTPLSPM